MKFFKNSLVFGLAAVFAVTFFSCKADSSNEEAAKINVAVTKISIESTLTLRLNAEKLLPVQFTPNNATNKAVTWTTSNVSVVGIKDSSKGIIVANSTGSATITATSSDGGFKAECKVTVLALTEEDELYTVKYFYQNIENNGYTENESKRKTDKYGKIGENTNVTGADTPETVGFNLKTVEQKKIQADGSTVVNVYYDRKTTTLTLNLAGGKYGENAENKTISGKYGATIPTPEVPAKSGYDFTGWNPAIPGMFPAENATHTATWTLAGNYTITYNLNGGTNATSNPTGYNIESETITLQPATKIGYTFLGWYSDSRFNTKVTQITKGSTGNKTLYAKWDAISITLTFELGGGTGTETLSGRYGESITAPDEPTKNGYVFTGWNPTLPESFPLENKTYTAKWILKNYTITYNLNGGTNVAENPKNYNIESETITLASTTKSKYIFIGWYTTETFDEGTQISEIAKGSTENLILYAKWTPTNYTITYNLDSGTNAAENPTTYNVETETITLAPATKVGFTFDGWHSDSEFTTQVTKIENGSTGNITLYAKWLPYVLATEDNVADSIKNISGSTPVTIKLQGSVSSETMTSIKSALIKLQSKRPIPKIFLDLSEATNLISIENDAFKNCVNLTGISLPNSITAIGEYAFYGCSDLTSINIPSSVTTIGKYAFYKCSGLTSFNIPSSITVIRESTFRDCTGLTSITIPNSITTIEAGAFYNCRSVTSIDIPNSVTSIGGSAFFGCQKLTTINIPDSITIIEYNTFSQCHSFTNIVIPNSITSIGRLAFQGCISLQSITISSSVTYIGIEVFWDCYKLDSVTFENKKGWEVSSLEDFSSDVIQISESDLNDDLTAARHLGGGPSGGGGYSDRYWRRVDE